jgi:hypothetical protein
MAVDGFSAWGSVAAKASRPFEVIGPQAAWTI